MKGPRTIGTNRRATETDSWKVDPALRGTPLSRLLAEHLLILEERAADLIDFGSVYLDGRVERDPSRTLRGGEEIVVNWPRHGTDRHYEIDPARILYRDKYLLAYDKEAGVPSQQTPADAYNNLFAALLRHLAAEGRAPAPYAALHHRLDKETSGVMVFALDRAVNRRLGDSFQERRVVKDYLAWVDGTPALDRWTAAEDICRKEGRYRTCPPGQGKPAQTLCRVVFRAADRALVAARPVTGRTHQIRLHLAARGHPVIGDRLYGKTAADRLYLHALRLRLPHPKLGSELVLNAPVPDQWPEPREPAIPD